MKQLIKISTYLFVFLVLLNNTSCRKKELRLIKISDKPFHCYNNVKDADEKIIDKGGSCGCDSVKVESKCGLKTNQIYFDSNYYDLKFIKKTISSSDLITLSFSFNAQDMLYITFNEDVLLNTALLVRDSYTINSARDKIDIYISTNKYSSATLNTFNGDVKILSNGCVFNLMTCGTTFYNNLYPSKKTCTMNVDLQLF